MAAAVEHLTLDRAHGRAPRQARSQRTMERIVTAAEALFAERGYDGASVSDIVSRADCSIGTFYARFTDKESLFLHLHAHHCRLMVENIETLVRDVEGAETGLADIIRAIVDAQFHFADRRRAITRVYIQRSGQDAAFHGRYARAWGETARGLRNLMLRRRDEIGHRDPKGAADFAVQMIHSGWANDVLHHGHTEITGAASGARLRRQLTTACLAYLAGASPSRP